MSARLLAVNSSMKWLKSSTAEITSSAANGGFWILDVCDRFIDECRPLLSAEGPFCVAPEGLLR